LAACFTLVAGCKDSPRGGGPATPAPTPAPASTLQPAPLHLELADGSEKKTWLEE
jgi:hypothetical protein